MKKILIIILLLMFSSIISATIIINEQPKEIYNLNDVISLPVTVKSNLGITGILKMDLICNGQETNFYKNGIKILAGEEKKIESSLILTKEQLNEMLGTCKIKASILDDYYLTNDFQISNKIVITTENIETEFNPEDEIIIEGNAIKENGLSSEGFISLKISLENSTSIEQIESIKKGYFLIKVKLPKEIKAGEYSINLRAYETDNEEQETNIGTANYKIQIKQIPTNLEIILENSEIKPGTNLNAKTILHDQTGEKIQSTAIITIKDNSNKIIEQKEIATDEFLEIPIAHNQPPEQWTAIAVSNKLTTKLNFKIKENKEVKIEIINKTLLITNIGNVFYNKTIFVKIGNQTKNIKVNLDVGKSQRYTLSAPDGEYQIEIIADEQNKINQKMILTGNAINVEKVSSNVIKIIRHPISWIFIIIILASIAFMIFRKGYKKSFIGKINLKKFHKEKGIHNKKNDLINPKNKAELSLSIKGDKQNADIICLKLKNLRELETKKSNAKEILQKIINVAETNKAAIYQNQENIFFIFAPTKTKTFDNEKATIDTAERIKEHLKQHNKISKQKINFGISINYGTIIAKQETDVLKFMSMGTLITTAKKTATLSEKEILITEKLKEKLSSNVKTQKHEKDNLTYYTIKEIINRKEHSAFIKNFLDKLEGKK